MDKTLQDVKSSVPTEKTRLITETNSVCPECDSIKVLPAKLIERDGKVFIQKTCPEHGFFEELYYGSADYYHRGKSFFVERGKGTTTPQVKNPKPICPKSCGLCKDHLSHPALTNIAVTNRCDLSCWYCFFFAEKAGYIYEPSMQQFDDMFANLKAMKPVACNALQFTGGEPTMREDLPEIMKLAKKHGFQHIQLNTHGIRLSKDIDFFKKLIDAGMRTIYLSFDGTTKQTNPKNHWEVPAFIENCRKLGFHSVVLVPTVIKGVNDQELFNIIKFAIDNIDVVRGINFQPVSLVGRMPKKEREKHRITIPDCIDRLYEQSNGVLYRDAFFPVPSVFALSNFIEQITNKPQYELTNHFVCGAATYLFIDGKQIIPITDFVKVNALFTWLHEKTIELKKGKHKALVALDLLAQLRNFIDLKKQPKSINMPKLLVDALVKHDYKSLGKFHRNALFIGFMHFQDPYNYDVERVKRCNIMYAVPDGRVIPFCAFNVFPQTYRDAIQKKFSLSFDEWEKKTGKKLKDDAYTRDKNLA